MKRALFMFLLVSILLIAPYAGFARTPFDDIQSQASADIEAVYEKGIMIGTASNKFSPDEFVDRAQLAVCLVKTFDLNYDDLKFVKAPVPSDLYDDVEDNIWYSKASMIIGYNKIFNIADRKFRPHEAVTRAEAASAIADSFAAKKLSVITTMMWPDYLDTTNLSQKQQSDISFVFNTGIMRYTGNEFKPDEKITRAELATILNRTLKTLAVATPAQEAGPGSSPDSSNPIITPPDVNTAAFKDQGALAFIRQGLLYTLDGETGEVKQLTGSGRALQPAWSHDGQWLAFIRVTDQEANTGPLWLVRRDGSQAHQVQDLPQLVSRERFYWSPTGNVLAVAMPDGVWLVPAEGEPRRLVKSEGTFHLAWSPDGKSLAYNVTLPSEEPQNRSDVLYTISVDGGQPVQRLVAPQAGIQVTAWWPDGKGLLYWLDPLHSASLAADGMGLWSLRLGDTEPTLLTSGLAHRGWLSLSPQGSLLMVTGGWRIVWARKSLATVDLESGSVQELNNPEGSVAIDPSFSPDGSRIAFVTAKNLGDDVWGFSKPEELAAWVATRTLWIRNSDGSGAHPLTDAGAGVYQPAWSKDGEHILYVRDNAIWIIGADGGQPEKVLGLFPKGGDLFGFYGYSSYQGIMAWYQP
ncbi:S-layer homology domain-containing protein [Pelotomaculum propionicicum]|uniref:Endo-1,4-beta-xylanase A n=1 Tax=Pelotomaculum propionicicum TaxID=258475 RepID=A0A4Y7RR79_9FIRM|nr:S-layer homology domain-containing protein [Pelotomaculum propionicicum]TEB10777.1 Endo-1,4-beta-xylanase A [Pelotomaculum propionicicum]